MTGRWWSAPAYLLLAALAMALAVLMIPLDTDGSYSCRGSAPEDVISPEPQESAAFRANFLDSGFVCNHRAERRTEEVAVALAAIAGGCVTWAVVRRRHFID